MKILLTGGTGLIGRALCQALLSRENYQLTVLTRHVEHAERILGTSVKLISQLDPQEVDGQNIIINLAGEPIAEKHWTNSQKDKIQQSRWLLTQQLSEMINQSKNPAQLFISGSAIGYYGRQVRPNINEEEPHCYHEFSHTLCDKWEQLALQASSEQTRVCLLRTGIVLASHGGALKKMLTPFKFGLGGKMASGKQYMSWIHLTDMVRIILFIIDNQEITGAINCTAPNPVKNYDFSRSLAKAVNRPCLCHMPAFVLKLLFGEMSDLFIYGQHVVPKKLEQHGFVFNFRDLDAALADIVAH